MFERFPTPTPKKASAPNPFEAGPKKAAQNDSFRATQRAREAEQAAGKPKEDLKHPFGEEVELPEAELVPDETEETLQTVIEAANVQIKNADLKTGRGYEEAARGILNLMGLRGLPPGVDANQFGESGKYILAQDMARNETMRPVILSIVNNEKRGLPSVDTLEKVTDYVLRTLRTTPGKK